MMPVQLWETTMNPESRLLKQLMVEDAAEANVVFSSLMGTRVSKRTHFLPTILLTLHLEFNLALSIPAMIHLLNFSI